MTEIDALVERLNKQKKLRLWSVIVTFFGDAIVPRGGAVSASAVQKVMIRMGFEPGAIRTAFSRLAADGWIVREKIGRSSFYKLSETGAETFADATRRIYAPLAEPSELPSTWNVVFSKEDFGSPHFLPGNQSIAELGLDQEDYLILRGDIIGMPDWFKTQQLSPQYGEAFKQLMVDFEPISDHPFDPLDALAVRCLLIHEWRRILLHLPDLHHLFQPPDWPEDDCHRFVSSLYKKLLANSETWIEEHAENADGPLPTPGSDLSTRFS